MMMITVTDIITWQWWQLVGNSWIKTVFIVVHYWINYVISGGSRGHGHVPPPFEARVFFYKHTTTSLCTVLQVYGHYGNVPFKRLTLLGSAAIVDHFTGSGAHRLRFVCYDKNGWKHKTMSGWDDANYNIVIQCQSVWTCFFLSVSGFLSSWCNILRASGSLPSLFASAPAKSKSWIRPCVNYD